MIHKDSARILVPAGIISAACAVFGWTGIFAPGLLGWSEAVPLVVRLLLVILGCMPLLWLLAYRLQLRALWVYRNTQPLRMEVELLVQEDSDHMATYVRLRSSPGSQQFQEIPVYTPPWNLRSVTSGAPAMVFIDPVSGKPLVIEIEGKRLWAMSL